MCSIDSTTLQFSKSYSFTTPLLNTLSTDVVSYKLAADCMSPLTRAAFVSLSNARILQEMRFQMHHLLPPAVHVCGLIWSWCSVCSGGGSWAVY